LAENITNEQLFEFMTKIYGEMQEGFTEINSRINKLESEMRETKNKVIIIEQEHGKKLDTLFDGYKQNSDKLDRIEKEVSKQEEIILRRIK